MLGLGIDADRVAAPLVDAGEQVENLLEGRDLELAVVGGAAQARDTFLCAQRLQFGKREILGEPARDRLAVDRLRRLSIRIFGMIGDVGGLRNLILVPRDEHPVPRSEEHTSELQSLMRISYAVFCLTKKHK